MSQYSFKWLHNLLIKSWSLNGLYFGHCLVRRNLIRVFELCILILVDLIFPGSLPQWFLGRVQLVGLAMAGCGSALSVVVTGLALLLTLAALSMYHGYGFVQYDRLEDVQAALDGEKGRLYKGYRLSKENCSALSWPQHAFGRKSAVVLKPSGKVTMWHLSGLSLNHLTQYVFASWVPAVCFTCSVIHLAAWVLPWIFMC